MSVFLRSASLLLAATTIVATGCDNNDHLIDAGTGIGSGGSGGSGQTRTGFTVTPLTANRAGLAPIIDANMVNAWGIASDGQAFWIANNASGKISVVAPTGMPARSAPASTVLDVGEGITGITWNNSPGFKIGPSNNRAPATFLVASETGRIFAINPNVSATPVLVVNRSSVDASYKGLAVWTTSAGDIRLAAADFHNARIDVFDASFTLLATVIVVGPNLRAGLAPFNIVAIGRNLYLTYAVQDGTRTDDVAGVGNGRIDVFDIDGRFVKTLLDGGKLNAPWGVVLAGSDFGAPASGKLIVGNFGDGTLLAVDPASGGSQQLLKPDGSVLVVPGVWGLMFGNGQATGATNALYFAAGPNDEMDGLFGRVVLTTVSTQ